MRNILKLLTVALIISVQSVSGQDRVVEPVRRGNYRVQTNLPRQYIWGLGFEIQSDAIGSGNLGLPEEPTSVPHDLVPEERERFYNEMLKGFRYCRLAGGLYFRGTTADQKELRGRWSSQIDELREMIEKAGIEGISLEYWSPTPYWKATGKYIGKDKENKLRCYGSNFKNDSVYKGDTLRFLNDFGESLVRDLHYFEKNRIPVKMWGLQNEPLWDTPYSSCVYNVDQYTQTFNSVAPKIKAYNPGILILTDSWEGPLSLAKKINADPETRQLVDAWVWHQIGANSNQLIDEQEKYHKDTHGLPVFQNEYEYLKGGTSPERCLNTVQNIMNWFTFVNSPTWFWIHALKPVGNEEAAGYALGFWKPLLQKGGTIAKDKTAGGVAEHLAPGHWVYNNYNWFALAGFLKHMPWNSRRYAVSEDVVRKDQRILAFRTPEGKMVIVMTNRSNQPFTFTIESESRSGFKGYRYTPENAGIGAEGVEIGTRSGEKFAVELPAMSWDFWVEQ